MKGLRWILLSLVLAALIQPQHRVRSARVLILLKEQATPQSVQMADELTAFLEHEVSQAHIVTRGFRIDSKRFPQQKKELQRLARDFDATVCIGSEPLAPFLIGKSPDLPVYSLGVLGLLHVDPDKGSRNLPNLGRLRGGIALDVDLQAAIELNQAIRENPGPFGAILSPLVPQTYIAAAQKRAQELGTGLVIERVQGPRDLLPAGERLIKAGIRTFLKVPDAAGVGNPSAGPVLSRLRLMLQDKGIVIMGLGPRDRQGSFGFQPEIKGLGSAMGNMVLHDMLPELGERRVRLEAPPLLRPYVLAQPQRLDLKEQWQQPIRRKRPK